MHNLRPPCGCSFKHACRPCILPAGDDEDGGGGGSLRRGGGKVEPSAGSAFSPPPPSFPSELPPIPGVSTSSSLQLNTSSAAEPVRVLPLRAPSPAATVAAANGSVGGAGGPTTGGGRGFLAPMPTAAPMTEREKELQAKAELRRARR